MRQKPTGAKIVYMKIFLNEKPLEATIGTTIGALASEFKPGADVLIVNGFPAKPAHTLIEGDHAVLIRHGEIPGGEEFDALLSARHTPGVHRKIKHSRVGVAGIGGLGSHIAVALARIGVGELILADFDVVEPSNLNRQYYFTDQLGMDKTEALSQTLRRINPNVTLTCHNTRLTPENIPVIYKDTPVLCEAFDVAEQKAMLVQTALSTLENIIVVAASGVAGYGTTETLGIHRLGPRLVVVGDLETEARENMGLMAPRVGVAAHIQANVVLRILLKEES